jgi:hypothetical protein
MDDLGTCRPLAARWQAGVSHSRRFPRAGVIWRDHRCVVGHDFSADRATLRPLGAESRTGIPCGGNRKFCDRTSLRLGLRLFFPPSTGRIAKSIRRLLGRPLIARVGQIEGDAPRVVKFPFSLPGDSITPTSLRATSPVVLPARDSAGASLLSESVSQACTTNRDPKQWRLISSSWLIAVENGPFSGRECSGSQVSCSRFGH